MADGTSIEWTDATWNVVNGCSVTSPGCTNCFAMRLAGTRLKNVESRKGLTVDTKAGPVWNGTTKFNQPVLLDPIRWKRPRRIFVCAHGDLFHESVPDEWIDRVFAVMALAPQHQFQVLTKRSARMRGYFEADPRARIGSLAGELNKGRWRPIHLPLPNVWLGVSVEDQPRADERIPDLLATPAAVRWLSCEPLLGPVRPWTGAIANKASSLGADVDGEGVSLDWIVAGGESGPGARPMHPDWARSLRDQCANAGVPFLFKQWGNWGPDLGGFDGVGGRVMDGAGPCAAWRDGQWHFAQDGYAMPIVDDGDEEWLYRLGKKANGRHLDRVLHDGFPA